MTDEAKINIECDKLTGKTTQAALEGGRLGGVLLDLPYTGSWAVLKTQWKWIMSRYADKL